MPDPHVDNLIQKIETLIKQTREAADNVEDDMKLDKDPKQAQWARKLKKVQAKKTRESK